jgi:hypothetical protein
MLAALLPEPLLRALALPLLVALTGAVGWLAVGTLARHELARHGLARHEPARHVADGLIERLFLWLALGFVILSWLGALLGSLGLFRWPLVLAFLAGLGVLRTGADRADRARRVQAAPTERAPRGVGGWPHTLAALALFVIAGWLYARPAESLYVSGDAGVYTLGGVLLAREGSFFVQPDAFWQTHDPTARQFYDLAATLEPTRHWLPFYQWTMYDPTIEIGFYPLPKVWIAYAAWLYGAPLASFAAPLWGLLGVMALYILGKRLGGPWMGLFSAALLAPGLAQVWFSRLPASEMCAQATLLIGLALLPGGAGLEPGVPERDPGDARLEPGVPEPGVPEPGVPAILPGLAMGAYALCRFEAPVFLAALALLLWLGLRHEAWPSRVRGQFVVALALSAAYGTLIAALVARHYVFTTSKIMLTPALVPWVMAAALLGPLLVFLLVGTIPNALREALDALGARLRLIVAAAWLVAALLALKGLLAGAGPSLTARWLLLYLGPWALGLGMAGCAWVLASPALERRSELLALLGLAALFGLSFGQHSYVTAVHPWAIRRLTLAVLPALALGGGALLALPFGVRRLACARWQAVRGNPRHALQIMGDATAGGGKPSAAPRGAHSRAIPWLARALSFAALALALCGLMTPTLPILWHADQRGLYAQLAAQARATFAPDSLLLLDGAPAALALTQPLELLLGYPALALHQAPAPSGSELDRLTAAAQTQGRAVYWLVTGQAWRWEPSAWRLVPAGAVRLDFPSVFQPPDRLPELRDVALATVWVDAYRVLQAEPAAPAAETSVVAGPGDYLPLRAGFYGWELDGAGGFFRWTAPAATIILPRPANAQNLRLELDLAGGRAPDAPACEIAILVEGEPVYSGVLPNAFAPTTLTLDVPVVNAGAPELEIVLRASAWLPGGPGDRALGAVFYGARARAGP